MSRRDWARAERQRRDFRELKREPVDATVADPSVMPPLLSKLAKPKPEIEAFLATWQADAVRAVGPYKPRILVEQQRAALASFCREVTMKSSRRASKPEAQKGAASHVISLTSQEVSSLRRCCRRYGLGQTELLARLISSGLELLEAL